MKLFVVIISYIAAFICGMYAQSLAYFLADYSPFEPFPILIVFTILCFILYIFSIVFYWLACRNLYRIRHEIVMSFLILFALPVMWFSFIVCMFWWG